MFKVIFPSGYEIIDLLNDNIDVNVIFDNGKVFFATLFTINNVQSLMLKDETVFFWAEDMLIVANLEKGTIRKVVEESIREGCFGRAFCEIGLIENIYGIDKSYDELNDMTLD
jgi:hypothetical protein